MKKNKQDWTIIFKSKKYHSMLWKYQTFRKIEKSKIIIKASAKIRVEKEYKDTVFTKLFSNKTAAIALYNALYCKHLPENTSVQIITLDDTLFIKRKNDVAFLIDGHFLIFIEHQSTINENMPLRLLLYIAQEYEKIFGYRMVKGKRISNPNLYKKESIKIPKPEFFVLYNGTDDLTEVAAGGTIVKVSEKIMHLSDAFIKNSNAENSLELSVKWVDIRYATNHQSLKLEKGLSILGEYSYFISSVKEYSSQGFSLEKSIRKAAEYCIQHGILKDFLLKHETEVVGMLLGVYDEEMEKQVLCEEAEAKGKVEGRAHEIIDFSLDFGRTNEEILSALQKKLNIRLSKAEEYLKRFYDGTLL